MEEIKNTAAPADSEQVQVRRQKLADLRAAGSDPLDRKSTRLNSSHWNKSRMPSSA